MKKIIAQGAEALLIREDALLTKRRIRKGYRYPALDEQLRKTRTKKEAKLLEKSSCLVPVPRITKVDNKTKEIVMDFIEGKRISDCLDDFESKRALQICGKVGESIALLHDTNIIHGDLTTSNMILREEKIFFVDFGLGFMSSRVEDKAVDLHLLRQAFESKHFKRWRDYFDAALQGYKKSRNSEAVLKQLQKVEARGRYKGKH
jgi:TP53 regulating kinase-like protein